jgi:L-serine dehydratase
VTDFKTAAELLSLCEQEGISIAEATLRREVSLFSQSRTDVLSRMGRSLDIMRAAVDRAQTETLHSMGGLVGGEAMQIKSHLAGGYTASGPLTGLAMGYALGVMEVNAAMGLIVAAPTAGSSGVIPGVLMGLGDYYKLPKEQLLSALFCAGGVGYLIMRNATVSGAEGGCQAEVGSAAAMAAAAATQLLGGSPAQALDAAAVALMNLLGLVCDPVGGLVEVPCQKRNAVGVACALTSADMALAGLRSHIPLDEVITAMYAVGRSMPHELRETALGGVAATPSACALCIGGR